jgi:hypothetical protein
MVNWPTVQVLRAGIRVKHSDNAAQRPAIAYGLETPGIGTSCSLGRMLVSNTHHSYDGISGPRSVS